MMPGAPASRPCSRSCRSSRTSPSPRTSGSGASRSRVAATISRRGIDDRTRDLLERLGLPALRPDRPVRIAVRGGPAAGGDRQGTLAGRRTSSSWTRPPRRSCPGTSTGCSRSRAGTRDEGKLVLYISHRMDEVRRVADRVTVLRNGETVGTVETASVTDDDIVSMMLGRRLARLFPERRPTATDTVALTDHRAVGRPPPGDVRPGAARGRGAGRRGHPGPWPARAVHGPLRRRPLEGRIEVCGRPMTIRSPRHALSPEVGIALLPEDRRTQGLLLGKSVRDNIVLSALSRIVRHGFVDTRAEDALVQGYSDRLQITAASAVPAGRHPVGRQPAEGRAGQAAGHRVADPAVLRPDAGRRCRHQVRDLRHDARPRGATATPSCSTPRTSPSWPTSPTARWC